MRFRRLRNAILEDKRGHAPGSKPFGGLGAFIIDKKKVKSATGATMTAVPFAVPGFGRKTVNVASETFAVPVTPGTRVLMLCSGKDHDSEPGATPG